MDSGSKERAVSGRDLYEVTVRFAEALEDEKMMDWDELDWDAQDYWEQRADEINESRRGEAHDDDQRFNDC